MHKLTRNSQRLRRNMTNEERKLWYLFLKNLPVTIYRQKVIGNYIVDFYCEKFQVIIEIDGTQHFLDEGVAKDKERDRYLKEQGNIVLRYSNIDINKNFKNVCEDISNHIDY